MQGDGKPRFFFFRDLKNLLSEIYEYRWLPADDGRNALEELPRLHDHAMDALRYLALGLDRASGGAFRNAGAPTKKADRWK